jgi:tetratricopeptide (TPR) repeat protein
MAKEDLKGAMADCEAALKIDPADAESHAVRGRIRQRSGDREGALADCSKAVDLDPDDGWVLGVRACLHYDAGRWKEARSDFEKALGTDPTQAEYIQARLYLIRARQGEEDRARKDLVEYRKRRTPRKGEDWPDRILSLLTGELGEREFLDPVPSASKAHVCEAYFYAGARRLALGQPEEARPLLRKCIDSGQKAFLEYDSAKAELDGATRDK